ncbi:MAG: hypothetical protein WBM14_11850 [Terracidiphilus sp.]
MKRSEKILTVLRACMVADAARLSQLLNLAREVAAPNAPGKPPHVEFWGMLERLGIFSTAGEWNGSARELRAALLKAALARNEPSAAAAVPSESWVGKYLNASRAALGAPAIEFSRSHTARKWTLRKL